MNFSFFWLLIVYRLAKSPFLWFNSTLMFRKVTVIGDGAMGTVCGFLLCANGISTKMWGFDSKQIQEMDEKGENFRFLPGYKFPENLELTSDDQKAIEDATKEVWYICQTRW